MQNFDVELFDHDAVGTVETVRVRVVRSPAGTQREAETVTLPEGLRERAARLAEADLPLAALVALGEDLGQVLFAGEAGALFDLSRARLDGGEMLRLRVELRALALADLPWEYAFRAPRERDPNVPERGLLALDRSVSIVRFEPVAQAMRDLTKLGDERLRVAVLLANPRIPGWAELDLAREEAAVRAAFADRDDIDLDIRPNADDRALNEALDARPHVLHFAGHGRFRMRPGDEPGTFVGEGQLIFERDGRRPDPVSARELAGRVRGAGVRLIVLNCCESARRDTLNTFTGVAPTLVREGVPAVIAMQYNIRDAHAEQFARSLYGNLIEHKSVDEAVSAARNAMFGVDGRHDRDWGIPVLYLRSEQSVLFPDDDPPEPIKQPVSRLTWVNLALSGLLVLVLSFLYLRHVEPRLPMGKVVGGALLAAFVTALTYLSTVAGDALRLPVLRLLGKRRAMGALAGLLGASLVALALLPNPIGVRVVPGKSLLPLLPAANLPEPLQVFRLEASGGGRDAVAEDFRKSGVTLAGSQSLAGRLARRHAQAADTQLSDYLLTNGLESMRERFLGAWQDAPAPLGMRGFAKAGDIELRLHRGDIQIACRRFVPADLDQDMTVIVMENGDECQ